MTVSELLEEMQNTIHATNGLKSMFGHRNSDVCIDTDDLYFLLDLITKKQAEIVDNLHEKVKALL